MPGYKGHLMGGVVVYAIGLYALRTTYHPSLLTMAEWLGFALIGSLFPDIDTKSKGQKLFYTLLATVFCLLLLAKRLKVLAALGCIALVPLLVNHRGLFHRVWFVVALPLAVVFVCSAYTQISCRALIFDAIFFMLGALSHLWLDLGVRRMFRA